MTNPEGAVALAIEREKKIHRSGKVKGTMRSVRIHRYGGAEKLVLEDVPVPEPGPDEILIRVHAAGVNPVDWKIREGHWRDEPKQKLPLIPGWDVSGTVVSAGILVNRFRIGDKVFARLDLMKDGAYAEYAIAKTSDVARAPANISLNTAAGVPLAAQTAWIGLFEKGSLKAEQSVLIHGASGGVGSFAVQFAQVAGAHVIATTSKENLALVESLGADEVIDYKSQDFSKRLENIDMVFDTIGGDTQARSWQVIRKGGMLVSTLAVDDKLAEKYGVTGITYMAGSSGARLQEIAGLIDKHMLRVLVDKELPLEHAQEAHKLSQSGKARGKIILLVA